MEFAKGFDSIGPVPSAWQTLPSDTAQDHSALSDGMVIGAYDMIFTGDEEYARKLSGMGMLRGMYPVFRERIILVGPGGVAAAQSGAGAGGIMRNIFDGGMLFFSPLKNKLVLGAESAIWSGIGVKDPGENRQYVETGRDDVEALYQAGDEGGFMLVGEAAFAQYLDSSRGGLPLRKLSDTDYYMTGYLCLISNSGFRKERSAAADKYLEWLLSGGGRGVIEDFRIGPIAPFAPAEDPKG
jgi:ABC-type tungstate transport system permease subunit